MNRPEPRGDEDDRSAWRGIGGLAAGWIARIEAQRGEPDEDDRYVPVAWAAE